MCSYNVTWAKHSMDYVWFTQSLAPKRGGGLVNLSFQTVQSRKHISEPIKEEMSPDCL